MSNTIVDILNELRSQRAGHLRSKTLASSGDVAEAKVWAGYHEAVAEVRRVWGEPAFEGPGSRADLSPDGVRRVYGEPASEGPGWARATKATARVRICTFGSYTARLCESAGGSVTASSMPSW